MEFQGKGRPITDGGIDEICSVLGVLEAEIWAVLTVETRGFGFLPDRRPQILFERHKFHSLTQGRHDAGNADISNSNAGGYVGGAGEYPRLQKAIALDREKALQSASWGIGQVMGFNFALAGYTSVDALVSGAVKDEDAQLLAMSNFIKESNLAKALQRQNWASFARGYNGAGYKKNEYDTRLAGAHAKFKTTLPDLGLRTAQVALLYLGFAPGPIDGFRGRRTRSALTLFQEQSGLPVSGELDRDTETKLLSAAFPG
jgi:hypothetical protein